MPKPSHVRALSAALLLTLPLTGCGGGDDKAGGREDDGGDRPADLAAQQLAWNDCEAPDAAQGGGSPPPALPGGQKWQCATLKVPLDHDEPDGDLIDLALIRAKASRASGRIGSLVFNFGGPGGSGVATLPAFAEDYANLRKRYDLVSFDPRGVGRSDPVLCFDDEQLNRASQEDDGTPDDQKERDALLKGTKDFNAACEKNSGTVLPHVATTDAARDMDLLRRNLGDDKLYYFGVSYGTELGGVYAHLFPGKVGRAVFDAVVDPTEDLLQGTLGQAKGFQLALDNYARDCVTQEDDCPVGDSEQDVQRRITALLDDLDAKPLPGSGGRVLTQTAATGGIAQALYSKDFWPYLTQGLEEAYDGQGTTLLALADSLDGRRPDGGYSNLAAANTAINCADDKARPTVGDVEENLPAFRKASPVFGDYLAWSLIGCQDWAVPGAADRPDVSAPGAAPVLVVGNTGDPATPYAGARRMAEALGEDVGVQITYRGEGHGAYASGSSCVDGAVEDYLLDGKVPKAGTVCS
ncbi:alpha/beta hydrolase [Streptomyces sp. NPDC060194]|uniref:alpha/beta hydrolase n=1 Tax=Streptomyces sp. NPDC060194 TaxID=3347069 RepID=UPI00366A17E0